MARGPKPARSGFQSGPLDEFWKIKRYKNTSCASMFQVWHPWTDGCNALGTRWVLRSSKVACHDCSSVMCLHMLPFCISRNLWVIGTRIWRQQVTTNKADLMRLYNCKDSSTVAVIAETSQTAITFQCHHTWVSLVEPAPQCNHGTSLLNQEVLSHFTWS